MARIDLLLLANHKKTSYFVRWNEVVVDRWQLAYAMETLAQRWKWSRWKVNRFISVLQTKQQIVQQKNNIITVITIINYNKYQLNGTTYSTTDSTTDGQQTVQQTDIYKNVNNDKNINILAVEKKQKEENIEQIKNKQDIIDCLWEDLILYEKWWLAFVFWMIKTWYVLKKSKKNIKELYERAKEILKLNWFTDWLWNIQRDLWQNRIGAMNDWCESKWIKQVPNWYKNRLRKFLSKK